MPNSSVPARKQKRPRRQAVPRPLKSESVVVRRPYDAGYVAKVAADSGGQLGTVPTSMNDWSQLATVWQQFRIIRVVSNFIIMGEFDTTPAYPTLVAYHTPVSLGAPASLEAALVASGRRMLSFDAAHSVRTFQHVPYVFTDNNGFKTELLSPTVWCNSTSGFVPNFSSLSYWGVNNNTTVASPAIRVVQEYTVEFRYPRT